MTRKKHAARKKPPAKRSQPKSVGASVLADFVGLTDERLRQLSKEGMPKSGRGSYPLRDAVRWYVEYLRGRIERPETDGPTRADIERQLAAIKLKQAMGGLIDRQEVIDQVTGASARLAKDLETLATGLGREFNLPGEDVKLIQARVDEMRRAFFASTAPYQEIVEDGPAAKVA